MQSHCANCKAHILNECSNMCVLHYIYLIREKRALTSSKGHLAAISTCLRQPQFYIQFIYNPHFGT